MRLFAQPTAGGPDRLLGRSPGVPAVTILAITFTTAAAATLRKRLEGILGNGAQQLTITTFHAFGLRLIKHWSQDLGFGDATPAVYGRDDARALLREVAAGLGLEVAPETHARDTDPWALSLTKLGFALDRFRLCAIDSGRERDTPEDIDEELLRPLSAAYETLNRRKGNVSIDASQTTQKHLPDVQVAEPTLDGLATFLRDVYGFEVGVPLST